MKHVAYLVWLVAALVWLFGAYCLSLFKNALAAARELLCSVRSWALEVVAIYLLLIVYAVFAPFRTKMVGRKLMEGAE